jgi:hypothetical protein
MNSESEPSSQPGSPLSQDLLEKETQSPVKPVKTTSSNLEIMKAVVANIRFSMNRNAIIPQKAALFGGETVEDKIRNLASSALKTIGESQEASPGMLKLIKSAKEEELEGMQLMPTLQGLLIIAQNESIEANRRLASTNKADIVTHQKLIDTVVKPRVLKLMRNVHEKEVFCSEEICNFARAMQPADRATMHRDDLAKLEKDVEWILLRIWGKAASSIWRMAMAKCEKPQEFNSASSPRLIIIFHIWNLRFRDILKLRPENRSAQNALEEELCKSISLAIHGQILFQITNTRCIEPKILVNATRTAWNHLNSLFGESNPLSRVLETFLRNADSNGRFTIWEAIRILRKLWPRKDDIAAAEYRILNLNGIDTRIETGLADPDSLRNTSYESKFWNAGKPANNDHGKRKRETDSEDEDLVRNKYSNWETSGDWGF